MKLSEIKNLTEEKKQPGTYAAVKFDEDTRNLLVEFQKTNKIPNPVADKDLHCTLLYSRKHLPNYKAQDKIDPPYVGKPTKLEIWKTSSDNKEPSNCLILRFDCDDLVKRHKTLMDEHQATFDFKTYIPHVTLSYDIGDQTLEEFSDICELLKTITIVEEYSTPLEDDWADDHK